MPGIVIVGGGASGVLTAAQLLLRGADVTLFEPSGELGRGMAYSTRCPLHLLNVPAANMSALPDDREHFLRWLERTAPGQYNGCSFVPRTTYGAYIGCVLEEARQTGSGTFRRMRDRATGARAISSGVAVETDSGAVIEAGALILATGNAAPAPWPDLPREVAASGRFFNMAWMEGAFEIGKHDAPVLLLGTGLTAVDALLALRHNGHTGKVYMLSRRGLLPQVHVLPMSCCHCYTVGSSVRELTRQMRAATPWRDAVDSLRPQTNPHWQALTTADQRRFLRHARPFWDTHRHRMAPQIGTVVENSLSDGSLEVLAGRTRDIALSESGLQITVALRGSGHTQTLAVERVINCTGPATNLSRSANPLLRNLLEQGALQCDPHRLGALVDCDGAIVPTPSKSPLRIYGLGPLRMGTLIESVAIPEIRVQAQQLAALLGPNV